MFNCTMFIMSFVYTLLCRGEIGPSRSLKELVYTGSSKMDCINHKKYCQVFIPNFHPYSLIVLKCTVCLFSLFHIYIQVNVNWLIFWPIKGGAS